MGSDLMKQNEQSVVQLDSSGDSHTKWAPNECSVIGRAKCTC